MTEPTTPTPLPRTALPKAYVPSEVEAGIYERWLAADVFPPDGAGSTAEPGLPPFTIIQPPPNVTGSPPRPRPADRGRGPDDPARAPARASGAVPPGSTTRRSPRSSCSTGSSPKRARAARRWARAVSGADARVLGLDEAGHARAAAACRGLGRLGPPPVHDGRGLGKGGPGRLRAAVPRRPGVPHRGTHQLVPGCRTSVSDLEVIPTPETGTLWFVRYHLIDEATGKPDPTRGSRSPRRGRDDPRRHRGRGASRR